MKDPVCILVCGKDAQDNWDIIRDSDPSHTWVHLKSFPSPHVIIRKPDASPSEILDAAAMCKSRSRYKNINNIKVVYTKVDNIVLGDDIGSVVFKSNRKCNYIIPP